MNQAAGGRISSIKAAGIDSAFQDARAEKLGGSCEIIFAPGQGTHVTAMVPYK